MHFDYLYVSLKSLIRLRSKFIGNIYLYIDKEDFLNEKQLSILNSLNFNFKVRKCTGLKGYTFINGWVEQALITELQVFKEVSSEIGPQSYIAKADSDIFFISDEIFFQVLKSNCLMVGQMEGYWEPFLFCQGGLYFIKSSLAFQLKDSFNENTCFEVLREMNNETAKRKNMSWSTLPEDAAVTFLARSLTDKICFKSFFGRYSNHFKGSVIHFKNKKEMLKFDRQCFGIPFLLFIKYKLTGSYNLYAYPTRHK